MKRNILFTALSACVLLAAGCSENFNRPTSTDTVPPQPIAQESVVVTPIAGGAIIKYALPDEPDILAVEARYTISSGAEYKVRASSLVDSVVVNGYMEIQQYPVELYVVDRAGNFSTPITVDITPREAPINTIFASLSLAADFGGVVVSWTNQSKSPIAIFLFKENDEGEWEEVDVYYTDSAGGSYAVRGQGADETRFALQLRDQWKNYSDYYIDTITPLPEVELDYGLFSVMNIRYANNVGSANGITDLWTRSLDELERFHLTSLNSTSIPWDVSFTIGKTAKLSRIVIWQYGWSYNNYATFYSGGNARAYEFYGSNAPTEDGSLDDSWELFLTAEITKPSGEPYNMGTDGMTEEDFDIAMNRGHEFMVPGETGKYLYIRLRCMAEFSGGTTYGHSYKMQFFGNYVD